MLSSSSYFQNEKKRVFIKVRDWAHAQSWIQMHKLQDAVYTESEKCTTTKRTQRKKHTLGDMQISIWYFQQSGSHWLILIQKYDPLGAYFYSGPTNKQQQILPASMATQNKRHNNSNRHSVIISECLSFLPTSQGGWTSTGTWCLLGGFCLLKDSFSSSLSPSACSKGNSGSL